MNNQQIVNEIVAYIKTNGVSFQEWYVGIAANPRERLFSDHMVIEKGGAWIFSNAGCCENARTIESFLVENYKTKGDSGGGDDSTRYVYAYLTTKLTRE